MENGKTIKCKVRVLLHTQIVMSMRVSSLTVLPMAMGNMFTKEVTSTKVSGIIINLTERERPSTPKDAHTLEITRMATCTGKASISGSMDQCTKDNSKITTSMDTASTNG